MRTVYRVATTSPHPREKRSLASAGDRKLTALRGLLSLRLGQVVERVHQLGGRVYTVDVYVGGYVEEDVGVVKDDADVGVDHQVGDLLGGVGGGGDEQPTPKITSKPMIWFRSIDFPNGFKLAEL